jgi:hypothetical protein
MASIDANLCSLSAEVRSFLSRTIEWPVMNVAADQDSTSNDSVQPETVGRPGASKVGAWPIANVQPFRSTDQLWPVSP